MNLYPFQRQCVDFALKHHYTINACEMGLGKTRIALTAAKESGENLAVFGPPFLRSSWEQEAEQVGIKLDYFSYMTIHKLSAVTFSEFGFWIAEEVHYLKSPTAKRTHSFYSLLKTCEPKYFLGLSGTPIKNRVPDLWTLLGFCSLNPLKTNGLHLDGSLRNYHGFVRHFCHMQILWLKKRQIHKFGALKNERLPELKGLLDKKMIRFRVEDVLQELPDLIFKEVPLEISKPPEGLRESFEAYMAGGKADIKAKVLNAELKVPNTLEYIRSLVDGGAGPILIFTDHRASAKMFHVELKGSAIITGETPAEERAAITSKFQAGEIPFLVGTIGAMSVGFTLTISNCVVFNDLSWSPADNLQAVKRIHRIGQKAVCFCHLIVSSPTDAYIIKTLNQKLDTIRKAIA